MQTPPPDLSAVSADGRVRVELFRSEHTQADARNTLKPLYHALFRRADGSVILDSRTRGVLAWPHTDAALTLELAPPGSPGEWVFVDVGRGECYRENFREPVTATLPIERLAELL
jgi:hypothetical protein